MRKRRLLPGKDVDTQPLVPDQVLMGTRAEWVGLVELVEMVQFEWASVLSDH